MKDAPFESVWKRGIRIVEKEEIVEVDNGVDNDYWCRVQSQTHGDKSYDVHYTWDGWACRANHTGWATRYAST